MRLTNLFGVFAAIALATAAASLSAAPPAPSNADICRADVDGSGVVDLPDSNAVTAAYRTKLGQPKFNPRVDFDNDKVIDLPDRTFVTTKMGLRCVTTPVNRAPVFTTQPVVSALLGAPYAYQLGATDPDGDTVTFALRQGPAGLTLTGNLLAWTSGPVGTHTVRVEVADGKGGIATQQFGIVVTAPAPRCYWASDCRAKIRRWWRRAAVAPCCPSPSPARLP